MFRSNCRIFALSLALSLTLSLNRVAFLIKTVTHHTYIQSWASSSHHHRYCSPYPRLPVPPCRMSPNTLLANPFQLPPLQPLVPWYQPPPVRFPSRRSLITRKLHCNYQPKPVRSLTDEGSTPVCISCSIIMS